jgi:hypothetical protein
MVIFLLLSPAADGGLVPDPCGETMLHSPRLAAFRFGDRQCHNHYLNTLRLSLPITLPGFALPAQELGPRSDKTLATADSFGH